MKEHRVISPREELAAEDELFNAVLKLQDIAECRAFFQDLCTPAELQAMKDRWVQPEINALLERRLGPNPLVTIHKFPEADHAFARKGGRPYRADDAARALELSVGFFAEHLR